MAVNHFWSLISCGKYTLAMTSATRQPRITSMSVLARQARIVELLNENGELGVDALATEVGVSEITVRRDLRKLAARGAIRRSHGAATSSPPRTPVEELFSERELRQPVAKRSIGELTATLLESANSIVINDGTTTMQVAMHLAAIDRPRTVTTNACNLAVALASASAIEVSLEGGIIRRSSFASFSPHDEGPERNYDAAVIGVEAIGKDGIYLGHPFDDVMARRFIDRAQRVVVVADSSKWQVMGRYKTASWSGVDDLVTDEMPSAEIVKELKRGQVTIHVAPAE
jgi:DeoR/GlpR family transcriptional regulator of sugar metabolism